MAESAANTEIRELAVLLALADIAWDDAGGAGEVPLDGVSFADKCRAYGFIDAGAHLHCEGEWKPAQQKIAQRNYELGRFIADELEVIYPGSVEWFRWCGPENTSNGQYWKTVPADIEIKLAGTPQRDRDSYPEAYGEGGYGEFDDGSPVVDYEESDADISISLKDDSALLGNLGFSNVAKLLLREKVKHGTDVFEEYAESDYDAWFDVTWSACEQWLLSNDLYFEFASANSGKVYSLEYSTSLQEVYLKIEDGDGRLLDSTSLPADASRVEFKEGTSQPLKKCLSKWCQVHGFHDIRFLEARARCCRKATREFMQSLTEQDTIDRFYALVGYRMESYYYAKLEGDVAAMYAVPSYFDTVGYPLELELEDVYNDENQGDVTSAVVPFTLFQADFQVEADFKMYFSFNDGQFSGPPRVQIHTQGETANMYMPFAKREIDYPLR